MEGKEVWQARREDTTSPPSQEDAGASFLFFSPGPCWQPQSCSFLPTESSQLLFFLNLIFSGSESRSKEEILSSLLGIIPRISHWKCIHNYHNYLKKIFLVLFSVSFPSSQQAWRGEGRGKLLEYLCGCRFNYIHHILAGKAWDPHPRPAAHDRILDGTGRKHK